MPNSKVPQGTGKASRRYSGRSDHHCLEASEQDWETLDRAADAAEGTEVRAEARGRRFLIQALGKAIDWKD